MDIEPVFPDADGGGPEPTKNDIRPAADAKAPARISVHDNLYFQPAGRGVESQPSGVEARFTRNLRSDEQMYERRSKVGPGWKPLPLPGPEWIDPADCGMLSLKNLEGDDLAVVPTPDERAAIDAKVVEVGLSSSQTDPDAAVTPFARVRPGEAVRVEPVNLHLYRLRCPAGSARYALALVPG